MARRLGRSTRGACASVLLAVALGACGGASTAATAAGAATQGATGQAPAGTAVPAGGSPAPSAGLATAPSSNGAGSGGAVDLCKLFTESEMSAFLGRQAHAGGPQAATTPDNCTWHDDNLTTVWVLKSDPDTCASDKDAVGSGGGTYPGADFAGPSPLGAMFAGIVASGACYEVEVTPTERSPKADALARLLQQFVQRAGA